MKVFWVMLVYALFAALLGWGILSLTVHRNPAVLIAGAVIYLGALIKLGCLPPAAKH